MSVLEDPMRWCDFQAASLDKGGRAVFRCSKCGTKTPHPVRNAPIRRCRIRGPGRRLQMRGCVHQGAMAYGYQWESQCGSRPPLLLECRYHGELVAPFQVSSTTSSVLSRLVSGYHGRICTSCPDTDNGLSNVTLACVDCVSPAAGAEALKRSMRWLPFASVRLFSHVRPESLPDDIEWVQIWPLLNIDEYNVFMLRDFHRYVETPHVLTVQADGWVLQPRLWDPDWLNYDYIGAPWSTRVPFSKKSRVGNSGFCLRSLRLLQATAELASDEAIQSHRRTTAMTQTFGRVYDDVFTCCTFLDELLVRGMKIAPKEVAARFAFERDLPEIPGGLEQAFGFHGHHSERTAEFVESLKADVTVNVTSPLSKTELPQVTLACVDCVDPSAAARALWKSMQGLEFGSVKLLTHEKPDGLPDGIEFNYIRSLDSLDEYNMFMLRDFHRYVETPHVLTVQADGWVLQPRLWDPDWLNYDYIGPPWHKLRTFAEVSRVGGSGFCLRSLRLLQATADIATDDALDAHRTMTHGPVLDDVFCGWTHHGELMQLGMKFAPVEAAARFGFEEVVLEVRSCDNTFGFHGHHTIQTKKLCEGIHVMRRTEAAPMVIRTQARPLLSVMVAGLHSRQWETIVANLRNQSRQDGQAEVCVIVDDGRMTSGWKRNRLMEMAQGGYVAFVDDDDEVSEDYIDHLLAGCRTGKDVITFDLERKCHGETTRQSFGVRYVDHQFQGGIEYMVANHLCAWKRNIATKVTYDERIGYGDDQMWYKPLIACFPNVTEYHLDKVLYKYWFTVEGTVNQKTARRMYTKRLYKTGAKVYRRAGEIFVARDSEAITGNLVAVRNEKGQIVTMEESALEFITTVYVR